MTGRPGAAELRLAVFTDATEIGGAEIALATLVAALRPAITVGVFGVCAEVVARVGDGRPGTAIETVPAPATVRDLRALRALRRRLVAFGPDVFHANLTSPWSCRYAILVARTVPGVRRVAVEQLVLPIAGRTLRVKQLTSRMLDAHVAVGTASARTLERALGQPAGTIRTIHNAVDAHAPCPRSLGVPAPRIVTLARLDEVKGLDVLITALRDLPEIHAVVVGAGPERAALETRARALGVADRFHLPGWDPQARARLGDADLFVLPSRHEGLPLSIAEAMLAGLAVVATDVGSVREIVDDGVTGLLLPPDDPERLAAAIRVLIADPDRRRRMGAAGRRRAEAEFTAPRMAAEFEQLYDELLAA